MLHHNFNGLLELSLCKRGRGDPQQGCLTSVLLLVSSLLSSHNIGCCDTRMTKHTRCFVILTCDSVPRTGKFQTGVQALTAVPGIINNFLLLQNFCCLPSISECMSDTPSPVQPILGSAWSLPALQLSQCFPAKLLGTTCFLPYTSVFHSIILSSKSSRRTWTNITF